MEDKVQPAVPYVKAPASEPLDYERVKQIVTEAFNRYHRVEHSEVTLIEHDIAYGIELERRLSGLLQAQRLQEPTS